LANGILPIQFLRHNQQQIWLQAAIFENTRDDVDWIVTSSCGKPYFELTRFFFNEERDFRETGLPPGKGK
jgi:hypothetical protein